MDAIRLRQISEALDYDKNINAMVFNIEKKRTAANPDASVIPYSQISAEVMTAIKEGVNGLRVLLESKYANLALMIRPGSRIDSQGSRKGRVRLDR